MYDNKNSLALERRGLSLGVMVMSCGGITGYHIDVSSLLTVLFDFSWEVDSEVSTYYPLLGISNQIKPSHMYMHPSAFIWHGRHFSRRSNRNRTWSAKFF